MPLLLRTVVKRRVTDTAWNKAKWSLSTADSLHFLHCCFPKDSTCAGWAASRNRQICCSGQRPVRSLQHRDSPGDFYFCQQLSFHQSVVSLPGSKNLHNQQRNMLWGQALLWTPGTRMPEKYRPGDHSSSFCCTYPGDTDNWFFFHIEWLTDIDPRDGKKVVNMLQN